MGPEGKSPMTLQTALARFLVQMEADGKSPLTVSVYARELLGGPPSEALRIADPLTPPRTRTSDSGCLSVT